MNAFLTAILTALCGYTLLTIALVVFAVRSLRHGGGRSA